MKLDWGARDPRVYIICAAVTAWSCFMVFCV
jgi:hypothetical protein